jgi:hypothetical protein
MSDDPQRDKLLQTISDKEKENARESCHRKLVAALLLIPKEDRKRAVSAAMKEVKQLDRGGGTIKKP